MQPGWIAKQCHCSFLFPHRSIKEMRNRLRAHRQQKRIQNKILKAEITHKKKNKKKKKKKTEKKTNCNCTANQARPELNFPKWNPLIMMPGFNISEAILGAHPRGMFCTGDAWKSQNYCSSHQWKWTHQNWVTMIRTFKWE